MLVKITFGRDNGRVVDVFPHEAHAMLADGRAVRPDQPVVTEQVAAREDRSMPRTKRRAVR